MVLLKHKIHTIKEQLRVLFTFHYGLIKTPPLATGIMWSIVFTFHYGLIKTQAYLNKLSTQVLHLHSTMVLLKRSRKKMCPSRRAIYIPLWSY